MSEINLVGGVDRKDMDDEEMYILTPWGCLSEVLEEYGIDTERITAKIGEHMVDDFMKLMIKSNYVKKKEEEVME